MDFSKIRDYLFLGSLLSVTIVLGYLLRPFAYPIFWAAVVAALFYPFYQKLTQYLKSPNFSSLIVLFVVTIIIILPLTAISALVINETVNVYNSLNDNRGQINTTIKEVAIFIKTNPYLSRLEIDEQTLITRVSEVGNQALTFTFNTAKQITQNSLTFAVMFVIMLYTLFFFLRDGEAMLKKLMFLLPLGDKYEMTLYKKFTTTARAAIQGTLVIGTIQGMLGGLLFAAAGIPGALIWGIIMILLSVLPGVGSFIVWLPTAIIMFIVGNSGAGIAILVGGTFISTVDNILRPILVGKDLQMHPLIILFSTLGGIALFGISGFVIGPIIAALFLSFWKMYEQYYHQELSRN